MALKSRSSTTPETKPAAGARASGRAGAESPARGKQKASGAAAAPKKTLRARAKAMPGRVIGRTPWLRRRYARMMLRSIAKRRRKGKPLPAELLRLERDLRGLAPGQRERAVEQALELSATPQEAANRAMRRASSRPERHSGKGTGRRPGQPPGQPRPRLKP